MASKLDKKCKIAGCTKPFTEKELCRLKAAIMKLNLMPPNYGQTKKNLDTKRAKSKKDAKSGRKQTKTKNSRGTKKKTDQRNDKQEASISSSSLDSGSSSDKDLMMDSDDSFWDAIAPILEAPKKEETKPRLRNPRKAASTRSNEAVDRETSPMQVMSSPIRQRCDRFNAVVLKSFKSKRRRSLSDSEVIKSSNDLQV
ncbi:hypothetical protein WR25_12558 [Diploscapter pachys]|uniref:Uncharacterized protein n=1 Tax=Diploscapter pachys TaxID=2018661 RepID=A0A2A2KTX8_9BILA|nr:hypothetical protein WR25_12558 [Diploscapter pachys]